MTFHASITALCLFSLLPAHAWAQQIPSAADAARVETGIDNAQPASTQSPFTLPEAQESMSKAPAGAEAITFLLRSVTVEGATAFPEEHIAALYADELNTTISLNTVWDIAERITALYRDEEYFLSRAYVPAQEIDDGHILIKVIEGRIGDVILEDKAELLSYAPVRRMIDALKAEAPLKASDLERFVLRLNDLPGHDYRAVLKPQSVGQPDMVALSLVPSEQADQLFLSFDNYGSRYLGPYQATATYATSFHPLHQTVLAFSASTPWDELKYGAFAHRYTTSATTDLELSGSYVEAEPGYTLEDSDIESQSLQLAIGMNWRPIRQWRENLTFSLLLDGQNTNGDILGSALTRDRIRSLRGSMTYERTEDSGAVNFLSFTASQGLSILGASEENDLNLSRAEAEPDFTKLEFTYTRQQYIGSDVLAVGQLAGQYASAPLYSAEEFGFGGQRFGRAYDPSEITGDHGIAASVELQYRGLPRWMSGTHAPFVFYDIGKVWNEDSGGQNLSASSAGVGVRSFYDSGLTTTFTVAQPLTREQEAPLYGDANAPRFLFQVTRSF